MSIKFYWNTTTPIYLQIANGCCHILEEASSCNTDRMAEKPKVFTVWLFKENVC